MKEALRELAHSTWAAAIDSLQADVLFEEWWASEETRELAMAVDAAGDSLGRDIARVGRQLKCDHAFEPSESGRYLRCTKCDVLHLPKKDV